MALFFGILSFLTWIYIILLIARLILDWLQVFSRDWTPKGVVLVLAEAVYSATDPPLRAVRRVLKPVRIGSIQLDLAFMVVLLAAFVLQVVFETLAASFA